MKEHRYASIYTEAIEPGKCCFRLQGVRRRFPPETNLGKMVHKSGLERSPGPLRIRRGQFAGGRIRFFLPSQLFFHSLRQHDGRALGQAPLGEDAVVSDIDRFRGDGELRQNPSAPVGISIRVGVCEPSADVSACFSSSEVALTPSKS
jgi:hypothetical protein